MEKDMRGYRPKKRGPQSMETATQVKWRNTKTKTATTLNGRCISDRQQKEGERVQQTLCKHQHTAIYPSIDTGMKRKEELRKLKPHKAPSSDQITNEMIISLGSNGMAVLLRHINIT